MKHMVVRNGYMEYTYSIGWSEDSVVFVFNTLAEVAEPFQPWFKNLIKRRSMNIAYGVELDSYPWVVDKFLGFNARFYK